MKINGKEVTQEEVDAVMADDSKTITSVSVGFKNENKVTEELSHVGFEISQAIISGLSLKMEEANANEAILKFEGSPMIMGKTLYIIMCTPDAEINKKLNDE